ncbi:MAG: hypothetical protein HETSPECPRED_002038 [Heterodermia speciosa]|uniref:Uncharacterized protein n=1 Tax=Heterodermia speciosa TaxID=116794 RepID=A0A8H3F287_9LECA|nr:MAG: hypothetical protein HETSPECPRED_002038 [Heterodermia speciosa]
MSNVSNLPALLYPINTVIEANNQPSVMPAKHRATGASVQRGFDLAQAQKMAERNAATQDFHQTLRSKEFFEKTATALTDKGPDRAAMVKEYIQQTLGAQPDPGKCLSPGCMLCHTGLDKQQMPDTPPLSPKEALADPSSWQIIEPDGKTHICFAEADPETNKPELPAQGAYYSPSASSASIEAEESAVAIEDSEDTTSESATQSGSGASFSDWSSHTLGLASASCFPESPPIKDITVTTEVHSTACKHYIYVLRIEYRSKTNIGEAKGLHNELGTLGEVIVKDVFDNLGMANREVERVHRLLMIEKGLREMDTVRAFERLDTGDRLFVFLDNPRTFESWSIYTDERVLR